MSSNQPPPLEMASLPSESQSQPQSQERSSLPAPVDRRESEAIGPPSEDPQPKADPEGGTTILITLLLSTNSRRHPYKIDERYLRKRNVTVEDNDPWNLTVYTLKELILRDWREEWEDKPSSPSQIRLIAMGHMLEDQSPLKDCRFNRTSTNVLHMSIRPDPPPEDEDVKTSGKTAARDSQTSRSACCGCVIL